MPLSIFKKLNLGEIAPTTITLQLADRSLTYPKGIIEDPVVKGQDDARQAKWFSLKAMPELAFDHAEILAKALDRKRKDKM